MSSTCFNKFIKLPPLYSIDPGDARAFGTQGRTPFAYRDMDFPQAALAAHVCWLARAHCTAMPSPEAPGAIANVRSNDTVPFPGLRLQPSSSRHPQISQRGARARAPRRRPAPIFRHAAAPHTRSKRPWGPFMLRSAPLYSARDSPSPTTALPLARRAARKATAQGRGCRSDRLSAAGRTCYSSTDTCRLVLFRN